MSVKIRVAPGSRSIVDFGVSMDGTTQGITHVRVDAARDADVLGWNTLYARLWAHAELELAGTPDWENAAESWVRAQLRAIEGAFPGSHPDLISLDDLTQILASLGIDLALTAEADAVAERVAASLGDRNLGAENEVYAQNYFTQARAADGSLVGWWKPAEWETKPVGARGGAGRIEILAGVASPLPASKPVEVRFTVKHPPSIYFSYRHVRATLATKEGSQLHLVDIFTIANPATDVTAEQVVFTQKVHLLPNHSYAATLFCDGEVVSAGLFRTSESSIRQDLEIAATLGTHTLDVPYINQLALDDQGGSEPLGQWKCLPSSTAMVLAYQLAKFGIFFPSLSDLVDRLLGEGRVALLDANVDRSDWRGSLPATTWVKFDSELQSCDARYRPRLSFYIKPGTRLNAPWTINGNAGSEEHMVWRTDAAKHTLYWTYYPIMFAATDRLVRQAIGRERDRFRNSTIIDRMLRSIRFRPSYSAHVRYHLENCDIAVSLQPQETFRSISDPGHGAYIKQQLLDGNPLIARAPNHYIVIKGFRLKSPSDITSPISHLICHDPYGARPDGVSWKETNPTLAQMEVELAAELAAKFAAFRRQVDRYSSWLNLISELSQSGFAEGLDQRLPDAQRTAASLLAQKEEETPGSGVLYNDEAWQGRFGHFFDVAVYPSWSGSTDAG